MNQLDNSRAIKQLTFLMEKLLILMNLLVCYKTANYPAELTPASCLGWNREEKPSHRRCAIVLLQHLGTIIDQINGEMSFCYSISPSSPPAYLPAAIFQKMLNKSEWSSINISSSSSSSLEKQTLCCCCCSRVWVPCQPVRSLLKRNLDYWWWQ